MGAQIVPDAASLYGGAQMVVKVKEPIASEYGLLRKDHILFSYLHLAATPKLAQVLVEKGLTAVAFETVEANGKLPLLAPMSDIAGRLAVHIGTTLLHSPRGRAGCHAGRFAVHGARACRDPRRRRGRWQCGCGGGRARRAGDRVRAATRGTGTHARARPERDGVAVLRALDRAKRF